MSLNSTSSLEHLLLKVRKVHLRPDAHRDKTRGQHPDTMISIRVQNMMKPQQMVCVMMTGGQGGRYETGDAGGVLIGGKLGKPGNITQLVREPCIGGEILGHIQAAAQLSQVQYQTQQLYMPSPCQLTCATERHGGQGQDGPGVRDQPDENWDGLPRGGEIWSNS